MSEQPNEMDMFGDEDLGEEILGKKSEKNMKSENGWRILDEADDDWDSLTEEQREALQKAYSDFVKNFLDYIKNVNPELFQRAKEYAIDYSKNDVVQFFERGKESE